MRRVMTAAHLKIAARRLADVVVHVPRALAVVLKHAVGTRTDGYVVGGEGAQCVCDAITAALDRPTWKA